MSARERFLELMGANSPRPDARMTVENLDVHLRLGDRRLLALGMVALAEHLETAPKPDRTEFQHALDEAWRRNADAGVTGRAWSVDDIRREWAKESAPTDDEIRVVAEAMVRVKDAFPLGMAMMAIRALDEYRAGKRGEG